MTLSDTLADLQRAGVLDRVTHLEIVGVCSLDMNPAGAPKPEPEDEDTRRRRRDELIYASSDG